MNVVTRLLVLVSAFLMLTMTETAYAASGAGVDRDSQAGANEPEHQAPAITGKVTETMDSGGYSYICLENNGKKTWVAVTQMKVKVGDHIAFYPGSEMSNFKSKTLNRTFDKIVFSPGPIVLPGTKADKAGKGKAPAGKRPSGATKVEKASGANAYTVADLYGNKEKLDGKEVKVSGKVVKVSENIMGKNWVHLEDGTGDPAKGTNHLVVTTADSAEVGKVVTFSGTLTKDKDFGYGYKYDVILEDASLKK